MNNNPFLHLSEDRIINSTKHFHIIRDKYPVSENHMLIISKREVLDYFSLSGEELDDLHNAINEAKKFIVLYSSTDGYNIGMNCGAAAGQTVFHFHCHVIPRYM